MGFVLRSLETVEVEQINGKGSGVYSQPPKGPKWKSWSTSLSTSSSSQRTRFAYLRSLSRGDSEIVEIIIAAQ